MKRRLALAATALAVAGCAGPQPDRYAGQFDDWMFLVDDKVLLNRVTMRKFGIRVGEVTLSFRKP